MKMLFACLSFVFTFSAFAESPIPVEPMLLEELLNQAGTIKVQDEFSGEATLSYILSQVVGYPDVGDKGITHVCDYSNDEGYTCTLSITIKRGDGADFEESAIMINYDAVYDDRKEAFKVSNVRTSYAG